MAIHFILIVGHEEKTKKYREAAALAGFLPLVTDTLEFLSKPSETKPETIPFIEQIDLLILPGGGDISPRILEETDFGSTDIDEPLDYVQLAYFQYFKEHKKPVIGICKGMQLINIALGGTLTQNMSADRLLLHASQNGIDSHHSCNYEIPEDHALLEYVFKTHRPDSINSAHHQCIRQPANDLIPFLHASDGTIEGLVHKTLPIIGLQWHPERKPCPEGTFLKVYLYRMYEYLAGSA